MEESKIDLGKLKVDQLGFVYKDIEKQAKIFETLFNIPKFAILPEYTEIVNYRGKDVEMTKKIATSRQFNTQIEFIQHLSGESVYKEFLDKGREGLHHISFYVENNEAYIEFFKNRGIGVIFSGSVGKQAYIYFDTEETFGMILEVQETKKRRKKSRLSKFFTFISMDNFLIEFLYW
ncbi:MAG: VOC family protein [Promethearchaeota archaeon]